VEHRVVGVFPSLIGEAFLGLAEIFDEAVAVPIAVAIDPLQRRLGVGPELADGIEIGGAPDSPSSSTNSGVASMLP
jgi:hypothetical protein